MARFHEGLNMAATWNIPVVFVCENNLYATEMPFYKATKNTNVASRAAAYGMPGLQVDGNNVLEVYEKAGEAIERARGGGGPTLLECLTYRWFGHHEGDPGVAYVQARRSRNGRTGPGQEAVKTTPSRKVLTAAEFEKVDLKLRQCWKMQRSSPWPVRSRTKAQP